MLRATLAVVLAALAVPSALATDAFMGDWQGTRKPAEGEGARLCAQVIPWGKGKYQANLLKQFDARDATLAVLHGTLAEGKVTFEGKAGKGDLAGTQWTATCEGESLRGSYRGDHAGTFALQKVTRLSPTLGAEPPQGAIVLFDGTEASMGNWQRRGGEPIRWKLDEDEKSMTVRGGGIISKHKFADHKLHIEFRTPYQPTKRGQGRGNSGVYLQGRYEVQVLDSYGLEGRHNECGGIYSVAPPRVNMCAPPLQWQTYDIVFHAPRFDDEGKKTKNAVITVRHNGVLIHEDQEIPKPTTAHWGGEPSKPNGVHIQDHGNPVSYRNIWAIEMGSEK